MSDFDSLETNNSGGSLEKKDDLWSLLSAVISSPNYKIGFFLMIIFIILSTNIFDNLVLKSFQGTMEYQSITTYGIIIKSIFLVLGYLLVDLLSRGEIL
jgi:hypothetical protein